MLLQDAGEEERDFEVHGGVTSSLWFVGVLKTRDDEDSFTIQDIGVLITAMGALGAWFEEGYKFNAMKNHEHGVYMLVDFIDGKLSN